MSNLSFSSVGMYRKNPYVSNNVQQPKKYYADVNFENKKADKSNNGKFDISQCGKNFIKGIISPIKAMIKHPIATLGIVASTLVACSLVPVLGSILTIGFGVYGVYQMAKGIKNAVVNYKNGNYDEAEKSCFDVGEGFVGTALSATGIKSSLGVLKEAKMMKELDVTSLTNEQRLAIKNDVKSQNIFTSVKNLAKTLFTKEGLSAIITEFKPTMMKARISEFKNFLMHKGEFKEVEETVTHRRKMNAEEFKKTPEGIRRANLSEEQIEQEVTQTMNTVFDRLGIKKELRPDIKIQKAGENNGGGYNKGSHEITFNPEAYKAGKFEMEDVIMHEATHCKEALLRAGIPKARAEEIVKEELISRILNGESEEILVKGNFIGADMMTPPKMSSSMKNDFIELAKNDLYTEQNRELSEYITKLDSYKSPYIKDVNLEQVTQAKAKVEPLLNKLQALIDKYPEFAKQYSSSDEALEMLAKYSLSHNIRYNYFSDTGVKTGSFFRQQGLQIDELSGEKLLEAEQSLRNEIATVEGNARVSGFKLFANDKEFNQYQFSPEEVLAQQNGNNYLITAMTNKINTLRQSGKLTQEAQATIMRVIEKAQKVIEYKTKGLEFYNKYTESINNPNDKELANLVEALGNELKTLKSQIDEYDFITITETIKKSIYQRPSEALSTNCLSIINGLSEVLLS